MKIFSTVKLQIFVGENVKFLQSKQEFPEGCRIYKLEGKSNKLKILI